MRLSDTELKQFRRDVARLKSEGLIPPKNRNGNPVNVKTARPSQLVQGKSLLEYVRDKANQEVLKNRAVTLPASRVKDSEGFLKRKVKGGSDRVIVPVPKDASVTTEKGKIVIKHESETGSITRVQIPRKNLRQYLRDAESLPPLRNGDVYAFYIGGNKSHAVFENADQLVEYLTAYKSHGTFDTDDDGELTGGRKNANVFKHLEIVRLNRSGKLGWQADVRATVRKHRTGGPHTKKTKAKINERRRVENMPLWKAEKIRAQKRERMRRVRRERKGRA